MAVGELARVITVLGGSYPFRLGRVRLEMVDLGDGHIPPREVMAICTEDLPPVSSASQISLPLIVGLGEVLNGRSLLLQVSEDGLRWLGMMNQP